MLRQKPGLNMDELEPLHFTDGAVPSVTGARRRLASKSPVDRSARVTVTSNTSFLVQDQRIDDHSDTFVENLPQTEPLNRLNILKNSNVDSARFSFRSIPSISESFVADTDYHRTFYSKDNKSVVSETISADRASRFCAIFSMVGVLFLVFVGILIESQPFYIKGIKGARPTRVRKLKKMGTDRHGNVSWQNLVEYSGHTDRGLVSWSVVKRFLRNDDDSSGNTQKSEGYFPHQTETVYKLRNESKNAFKAAAAYFLLMVLSIIYIHNQDWISLDMMYWSIYIRHHLVLVYEKYLRGDYIDIPDSSSVSPILPTFEDETMERMNHNERRDSMRKAQSLSSLELKSRRIGIRSHSMRPSRSKDKEK